MKPIKTNNDKNVKKRVKAVKWERNMALLYLANHLNDTDPLNECGYYIDNKFPGAKRVISLFGGLMTFRVKDDFDLGRLPEVEENWDGHTTEEKYTEMMRFCGCTIED